MCNGGYTVADTAMDIQYGRHCDLNTLADRVADIQYHRYSGRYREEDKHQQINCSGYTSVDT